jgi:hypothetical protein
VKLDAITVSAAQLAKILNRTPARIRQLVDEGVLVRTGRNRYPLLENVGRFIAYLDAGRDPGTTGGAESPRLRRDRAEAERAEMRVDRERDELLPRDQALAIAYDLVGRLQSRVLRIPQAWSVDVIAIRNRREAVIRLRPLVATLIETLQLVADEIEDPGPNGKAR